MKILNPKTLIMASFIILFLVAFNTNAQEGTLTINQDQDIEKLLAIKKDMNSSEEATDRYKIQVYSGNRADAEDAKTKVYSSFTWKSTLVYETPNYKIWVGSFRTRLEADRALKKIKNKFPSAFIFKPKKKKA